MDAATEEKTGFLARGFGRTLSEAGHSLSEASRTLSESSAEVVRTASRTLSGRTAELVRTISEKSRAWFCRRRWADMEDTDDERSPGGRLYLTGAHQGGQESGFGMEEKNSPSSGASLSSLRKRGHQDEPVGHHAEQDITTHSRGRAAPWICERRSRGKQRQADDKLQCQFLIGIEEDKKFQIKGRIFGRGGQNMKNIVEHSGNGTKLRLRGRGSGFLEGSKKRESSDSLMLCVSAPNEVAFQEAKRLTTELLVGIYRDYRQFHGKPFNELCIQINEGARTGAF